jgi:predicted metal-dependent HD superfamily phosphohydrolase
MRITAKDDQLIFEDYPFSCASIYKSLTLSAKDIESILPTRAPPEVWLKSGEIIFVSAESKDDLISFADQFSIRLEDRLDVWSLLTEECLDTEFSPEEQKRTLDLLAECGIPNAETSRIRSRIGKRLLAANSLWWEWIHLGQYDMLSANQGVFSFLTGRFKKLYWDSMEISRRSKPIDFDEAAFRSNLEALSRPRLYGLWQSAVEAAGISGKKRDSYVELIKRYSDPKRSYHNVDHIENVAAYIHTNREKAENSPALLWAALLHDFFPPWEKNAEQRSADESAIFLKNLGMKEELIEQVKKLIVFTAQHFSASNQDERMLADADLYILGEEAWRYDLYASQIRREYSHIITPLFINGRRKFLSKLLARIEKEGRLCFSLDQNWEERAKQNVNRELASLGG